MQELLDMFQRNRRQLEKQVFLCCFISIVKTVDVYFIFNNRPFSAFTPGGDFNFLCTGVWGHTIGKLTHPQTKAGPKINKNRPIPRLCTIKHEPKLTKLQLVLFQVTKTTHSQAELLK